VTVSPIKQYLDSTGTLPEDALLGYIAFTLGADGEHDRDKLVSEFEHRDLPAHYVPPVSRASDAFKKAIRNAQEHSYPTSATTTVRILFREVSSPNPEEVSLRAIMREERNDAKSRLAYDKVGEVKLYRGPKRNGVRDDSGARFAWGLAGNVVDRERTVLTELGAIVKADYERYRSSLEGTRVRALILDFLRSETQSVPMKASVHFVPVAHAATLRRFTEAIATLEGCRIDLVPLVDLVDQREHVLEALQQDNEAQLADLLADLRKAQSSNTTPKTYAALRKRYDAIMSRSNHYADLLDTSIERTNGVTDVAKAMLTKLTNEFIANA